MTANVAAFLASGELPVCGTKLRQRRLIPLWGFNDPSIIQRQEMFEPEIHADSITCSCRDFREFLARDDEYKVFSQPGTFDGDGTDFACHLAGFVVAKSDAHDRNFIVTVMEFIAALF